MSFARLQKKIDEKKNPAVAGLDPAPEYIPPFILKKHIAQLGETLEAAAQAVLEFNKGIIDAVHDIVPAVKPQSAYYEQLGPAGAQALKQTCDYAKSKGLYVIMDAKRGDIGTTAGAYSAAYLGSVKIGNAEYRPFDADALTVNAYLGSDGLKPFLDDAVKYDKAVFALVKTSNPSSGELQDRTLFGDSPQNCSPQNARSGGTFGTTLYTAVGDLIENISQGTIDEYGYTRIGAVVGATYPEEIKLLRERLTHTFFLVPGYGAQGASAADVAHAFDKNGRGAVVNSSRAIIAAWKKKSAASDGGASYAEAAREEALIMRDALQKAL